MKLREIVNYIYPKKEITTKSHAKSLVDDIVGPNEEDDTDWAGGYNYLEARLFMKPHGHGWDLYIEIKNASELDPVTHEGSVKDSMILPVGKNLSYKDAYKKVTAFEAHAEDAKRAHVVQATHDDQKSGGNQLTIAN